MTFRELAEMISRLSDFQKDRTVLCPTDNRLLTREFFDLKISKNDQPYLSSLEGIFKEKDELLPGPYCLLLNWHGMSVMNPPKCEGLRLEISYNVIDAIEYVCKTAEWGVFPYKVFLYRGRFGSSQDLFKSDSGIDFLVEFKNKFPQGPIPKCEFLYEVCEEIVGFLETWKKDLAK